jgi:hypothetical protein
MIDSCHPCQGTPIVEDNTREPSFMLGLLNKYMNLVLGREGVHFLPDEYSEELRDLGITEPEYHLLFKVARSDPGPFPSKLQLPGSCLPMHEDPPLSKEDKRKLEQILPDLTREPRNSEAAREYDAHVSVGGLSPRDLRVAKTGSVRDDARQALTYLDSEAQRQDTIASIRATLETVPFDLLKEAANQAGLALAREVDIRAREIKAQAVQRQCFEPATKAAGILQSRIETIKNLIEKDLFEDNDCHDCGGSRVEESVLNVVYSLLDRVAADAAEIVRTISR